MTTTTTTTTTAEPQPVQDVDPIWAGQRPWVYSLTPAGNANYQQLVVRDLFTAEECAAVLSGLGDSEWTRAGISRDTDKSVGYDDKVRSTSLKNLPRDESWPFRQLSTALGEINSEVFRFDLRGFYDADWPAVARYTAEDGDHFRPHQDAGAMHPLRKLTFVVQLTPGSEYRGGDLVFTESGKTAPRDAGCLIAFPSTTHHTVTPVTAGVRHTLIGWVWGPTMA